jgi:hypothetical protein
MDNDYRKQRPEVSSATGSRSRAGTLVPREESRASSQQNRARTAAVARTACDAALRYDNLRATASSPAIAGDRLADKDLDGALQVE